MRVLGVLIEKAYTTPAQYPLSLNAIRAGCNQASNRAPVMQISDDDVFDTLDSLRHKDLVREVILSGSRVAKYKQVVREAWEVSTAELVILAELMLRGPQTVGQIRQRASRMHTVESVEVAQNVLDHLAGREPPLIRRIDPPPGSRAALYDQLVGPAGRVDAPAAPAAPDAPDASAHVNGIRERVEALGHRLEALEQRIEEIARRVEAVERRLPDDRAERSLQ